MSERTLLFQKPRPFHCIRASAAIFCILSSAGWAGAQTLTGIGTPSFSITMSADGSTVAGYTTVTNARAFVWTRAGGVQNLGVLAGDVNSLPYGVSGDATVVVGYSSDITAAHQHPFRWTQAGGMVALFQVPSSATALASGMSVDGSVIVGYSSASGATRAFRWTDAAGVQELGVLPGDAFSQARAVSADGRVIVGMSYSGTRYRGFRWTSDTGMQDLGAVEGSTCVIPQAATPDGSVIVGESGPFPGANADGTMAFRWTSAGGLQPLGMLDGQAHSYALAVSGDGSVIVGYSGTSFVNRAVLFSASGVVDLNDYFLTLGIDLTGWELLQATGISANGQVISGFGHHNGVTEAWVATLPPRCGSADFNGDGDTGTDADIDAFFACLGGNCCPSCGTADFNGDGDTGTDQDIDAFFRVLAGGSC